MGFLLSFVDITPRPIREKASFWKPSVHYTMLQFMHLELQVADLPKNSTLRSNSH
jgi:hypothetical protein